MDDDNDDDDDGDDDDDDVTYVCFRYSINPVTTIANMTRVSIANSITSNLFDYKTIGMPFVEL